MRSHPSHLVLSIPIANYRPLLLVSFPVDWLVTRI